ncbi:MAG TPA: hypothetical protein QGF08_05475 [Candidatus Marinimicrobia bacterium]|jgi:hypothetical protein|nr:hypothetical protein [Candidatus Neomarinimicrobiota bacterium]HJM70314.1 hypothetical protein [Candidatus Neomarinimicrobiota bacterium]
MPEVSKYSNIIPNIVAGTISGIIRLLSNRLAKSNATIKALMN